MPSELKAKNVLLLLQPYEWSYVAVNYSKKKRTKIEITTTLWIIFYAMNRSNISYVKIAITTTL